MKGGVPSMGTEGVIRARLKNKEDLQEFIEYYRSETGGEPVDVDDLLVEVNVFSYGDREVLKEFLREKDAEIVADEIDDGDN
jgi:hypothetical protein